MRSQGAVCRRLAAERRALAARNSDLKITTDLPGQELVYLAVAGDRGSSPRETVDVHGVIAVFPQELTTVSLEMAEEVYALHAAEIRSGSRITSWPSSSPRASSRFASISN